MIQNHIWRSEANPNQEQAGYSAQVIPEHVSIVFVERSARGIATCAYNLIQTCVAQRLYRELLESPHQLESVSNSKLIFEYLGGVLTNKVVRSLNKPVRATFFVEDLIMPKFVALLELVEREIVESYGLGLDLLDTNSAQPFVILVSH